MFVLAVVKDSVKIHPSAFDKNQIQALTEEIDHKYANKVILDVGLCICLFDFEHIGDAYIYPLDGSAHYKATFRLLVFRPFVGEIITGRISSQSKEGIKVSLGFTDDIIVPSYLLQAPSQFDPEERAWTWKYQDEDGEAQDMLMEVGGSVGFGEIPAQNVGDACRFRVRTLDFTQVKATAKGETARWRGAGARGRAAAAAGGGGGGGGGGGWAAKPPGARSGSSVDLADAAEAPSAMQI
ncbi:unnamed protein product, partial [Heterosigma akashiwo]